MKTTQKPMEQVISFKIPDRLFQELKKYASGQVDDSGRTLSPSRAARRLVQEGLKRKSK